MVRFYSSFYDGLGFKDKKKIEEVENNLWTDLIKKEDYIFAKEED